MSGGRSKSRGNRAIGGWWSIGRFYVVVDNLGSFSSGIDFLSGFIFSFDQEFR
jgi:hypothetical protein